MELRMLGAVELQDSGRVLDVGTPQQRHVVAALAVDAGRPVITETLIDRVWDVAPDGARRTLHVQLTRIRRLLEQAGPQPAEPWQAGPQPAGAAGRGQARLVRRSGGYLLDIDPDRIDVHRFRRLVGQARDVELTDGARVALLREALPLWQGQPLAGLPGEWAARTREAWRREFLGAVAAWADTELSTGDPEAVVARLSALTAEYPLDESLAALLMRSLSTVGRTAEALEQYRRIQRRLADDLGTDPGHALRRVHQAILRGDPARLPPGIAGPPSLAGAAPGMAASPAQLPAELNGFAGRDDEVARLDKVLAERPRSAVVIACLSGMAGVGKTTLAVHWAHRVADRFPDGQLYVNLRGFDPGGVPVGPAEALRRFLDALGLPARRIPADLDGQIALYRSQLAGRRTLVVLDNACDVEQVRPLLPGSPGNLVVVTSRGQLPGLVAAEGAVPLVLDLPTPSAAHDILAARLGAGRVAAEPQAAAEIVARCGRLPLALAIVAARAASHPRFPLAALAGELRDAVRRLDLLAAGHPVTDVRAAFAWSYQALRPATARLFRLLAVHSGPDLGVAAAASLAGVPAYEVHPLLIELERAHLLNEDTPGRYGLHDLLRLYATELLHTHDTAADRRAALHRILDHYLATARAAALLLNPHRQALTDPAPAAPGVAAEVLDGEHQALAWFAVQRACLVAAIHQASTEQYHIHAWQLAWTTTYFLHKQGHWRDQLACQDVALAAAQRTGDQAAQAYSHRHLGRTYARLGRLPEAQTHLRCALALFSGHGDLDGQGYAHRGLSLVLEQQGRHLDALDHTTRALDLFRRAGNRLGEASCLNGMGWYHAQRGDYQQAITYCKQALTVFQALGNRAMEGGVWDTLGYAHHHLGDHPTAVRCYERSLDLYRATGERYYEADTLTHAVDSYEAVGDHAAARDALKQSLAILDDLGHPDADKVRERTTRAAGAGRSDEGVTDPA